MICDLAETYGILDYKALPPGLVATLTLGLREDSRIMKKIGKQKLDYTEKMLALIFDALQIIAFKQGHKKGAQKPNSLFKKLTEEEKPKDELMAFDDAEAFEEWRARKMKG